MATIFDHRQAMGHLECKHKHIDGQGWMYNRHFLDDELNMHFVFVRNSGLMHHGPQAPWEEATVFRCGKVSKVVTRWPC